MRLLFATKEPYLPEAPRGGSLDIHHMTLQLLALGHQCEVTATLIPGVHHFPLRVYRRLSRKRSIDVQVRRNGYVTHKTWDWMMVDVLKDRLAALRPHVVITSGQDLAWLAGETVRLGYPTIIRVLNRTCIDGLREAEPAAQLLRSPMVLVMSNSRYMATQVRERLGLESPVVYPVIRLDHCAVSQPLPEFVTFVNPITVKGLEIALRVAALLPRRRFLFVESWALDRAARGELRARLQALPNVRFRRRSLRMQEVYRRSALLLMPTQIEEAFGRVIVEAAVNGIPAVASRIGGIPEALGDGGILLSPSDPPDRWAEAIERILSDKDLYAHLGRNAVSSAGRAAFQPHALAQRFLQIADEHVRTCGAGTEKNPDLMPRFAETVDPQNPLRAGRV